MTSTQRALALALVLALAAGCTTERTAADLVAAKQQARADSALSATFPGYTAHGGKLKIRGNLIIQSGTGNVANTAKTKAPTALGTGATATDASTKGPGLRTYAVIVLVSMALGVGLWEYVKHFFLIKL